MMKVKLIALLVLIMPLPLWALGNDSLIQGSLEIHSDRLVIHFNEAGDLQLMEMTGSPASFRQLDDDQPQFVLLDEPFVGVDPISVADIQSITRQLADRGIGILITDHNVRETLGICDRAYIMGDGTILAEGDPDQILENKIVRKIY